MQIIYISCNALEKAGTCLSANHVQYNNKDKAKDDKDKE